MGSAMYVTLDITVNDALLGIICGVAVTDTAVAAVTQCYFTSANTIHVRVARWSTDNDNYNLTIKYI